MMTSTVGCSNSYSFIDIPEDSDEESIILSNQKALLDEVERRRTGSDEMIADIFFSSMSPEMEQTACLGAGFAMENFNTEQLIAQHLKELFDRNYGKAWQCICGKHFGSYVTFEPENFIYFRIGAMAFVLFRAIEVPLTKQLSVD